MEMVYPVSALSGSQTVRCMSQPGGTQKQGTPSHSASQQGPRGKERAQREVSQESRRGKQEGDGAGVARHKREGHSQA